MSSMIADFRETLLSALGDRVTINVREALAAFLGRTPSKNEIATARRAARRIAEEGHAVLMTAYPGQLEGVAEHWKWGRHAVLYLTVDDKVIIDLPCRVEVAAGAWEAVVEEGMRRTRKMIESDPLLSAWLPGFGRQPEPREKAAGDGSRTAEHVGI
jgi:hypothetical protein